MRRTRVWLLRGVVVGGMLALAPAALTILLLPAVVVAWLQAGAAVAAVAGDLERASHHLQVAVVAAAVPAVFGWAGVYGPSAVLALLAFAVAWRWAERARRSQRLGWGVTARVRMREDARLSDRRDGLRRGDPPA